jgi:hypothetical protein
MSMFRDCKSKAQLEEICLRELRGCLGLRNTQTVQVGPSTQKSWTWDVVTISPAPYKAAGKEARLLIDQLRQKI